MSVSMTHTPDEINEIRNNARNQARAVCAIIKKAWEENSRPDEPAPLSLKIEYEGHESQFWIERVVVEDAQEEAIKISEEFHYSLRDVIRSDPARNASSLISNITDLAGHGDWCKDDGGRGEIEIDLATGKVGMLTHEVRVLEYDVSMTDAAELMGEEPQGPQPG